MDQQRAEFDALVLAGGATSPRDLPVGRDLSGIHFAMEYLSLQNRRCEGDEVPDDRFIMAKDKHIVIIGGGDTGADCLGTVHPAGRPRGASTRAAVSSTRRARGGQPVAALAERFPRLVSA